MMTIIIARERRLAELAAKEIGLMRGAFFCPVAAHELSGMRTLCIVLTDTRPADREILAEARRIRLQMVDVSLDKLLGVVRP